MESIFHEKVNNTVIATINSELTADDGIALTFSLAMFFFRSKRDTCALSTA